MSNSITANYIPLVEETVSSNVLKSVNQKLENETLVCPYCKSSNIEFTGRVLLSYPSYNVNRCLDCGEEFNTCNNEKIPVFDYTKSKDVTKSKVHFFINYIIEHGNLPDALVENGNLYYFFKNRFGNSYYLQDSTTDKFIHLTISKDEINKAIDLHKFIHDKEEV